MAVGPQGALSSVEMEVYTASGRRMAGWAAQRLLQSPTMSETHALVAVIMGSKSDWETMAHAAQTLESLAVPFEVKILSAHRTPDHLFEYAEAAESRGLEVIIAAAGGAAHLAGVTAAKTLLPVLGVPMESASLKGMDSLLSTVQMPAGIPVGTLAIGRAGAVNAALLAVAMLANKYPRYRDALRQYREAQARRILAEPDPRTAGA